MKIIRASINNLHGFDILVRMYVYDIVVGMFAKSKTISLTILCSVGFVIFT